jgi:hypothetical protein
VVFQTSFKVLGLYSLSARKAMAIAFGGLQPTDPEWAEPPATPNLPHQIESDLPIPLLEKLLDLLVAT